VKNNERKPWLKKQWCLPKEQDADLVSPMQDLLSVDVRPPDPRRPLLKRDEMNTTIVANQSPEQPVPPGQEKREDSTSENLAQRKVFLASAPLLGHRVVKGTEHRTSQDWAHFLGERIEVHSPKAEKIVRVLDQLTPPTPASLSKAFAPSVARRVCEKLELHSTPTHASWLKIAEIEWSVLARQATHPRVNAWEECLTRVPQWQEPRHQPAGPVSWPGTTADARIQLKRLSPVPQPEPKHSALPAPVTI
jgi:hypothetical protein